LDHVSVSWAIDEDISLWYGPENVTIQWSIISEGLNNNKHPKGKHSTGLIIGDGSKGISVHHNLFVHNNQRNPLIKGDTRSEVINNVVYNWGQFATHFSDYESSGPIVANVVNNYYLPGKNSWGEIYSFYQVSDDSRIFINDIMISKKYITKTPNKFNSNITIDDSAQLYRKILLNAGANVPLRDKIDQKIIEDVVNRKGSITDIPNEDYSKQIYFDENPDTDRDGVPDDWELGHGMNPYDNEDIKFDYDNDGYSNIEEYLNDLANP